MGQTNSKRISHELDSHQNTYRDDQLDQILNDIDEDENGIGFSETGFIVGTPFIAQIITYADNTKIQKRSQVDFTYTPVPFVTTIVKQVFDNDDDSITIATITATVSYNANRTVKDVNVITTRP